MIQENKRRPNNGSQAMKTLLPSDVVVASMVNGMRDLKLASNVVAAPLVTNNGVGVKDAAGDTTTG